MAAGKMIFDMFCQGGPTKTSAMGRPVIFITIVLFASLLFQIQANVLPQLNQEEGNCYLYVIYLIHTCT